MKALPGLERLELEWSPTFVQVQGGKILHTVQMAPALAESCLFDVCIRLSELKAVLESKGTRLSCFETSLQRQEEAALITLMGLCQVGRRKAPGLETFLSLSEFQISYRDEDPDLLEEIRVPALRMLQKLEIRATRLSTQSLQKRILHCEYKKE